MSIYRYHNLDQAIQAALTPFTLENGLLTSRFTPDPDDPDTLNRLILHARAAHARTPLLDEPACMDALKVLSALPLPLEDWPHAMPSLFCLNHALLSRRPGSFYYELLEDDCLLAHIFLDQMPRHELLIEFTKEYGQPNQTGLYAALVDLQDEASAHCFSLDALPESAAGCTFLTADFILAMAETLLATLTASPGEAVNESIPDASQENGCMEPIAWW